MQLIKGENKRIAIKSVVVKKSITTAGKNKNTYSGELNKIFLSFE